MNVPPKAAQLLRILWRESPPECCVCRRPVGALTSVEQSPASDQTIVVFVCHGRHEVVTLPPASGYELEPGRMLFEAWPKRVFLKNWARYSLVKPKREGRLE